MAVAGINVMSIGTLAPSFLIAKNDVTDFIVPYRTASIFLATSLR